MHFLYQRDDLVPLSPSVLCTSTIMCPHEITTRYVSALNDLVDKHAPLLQLTITVRPHAGWYNEQLRDAKHVRRQLKRKWRHSKTESDHEAYRKQCSVVAKELYTAETEFYSNKIIDNQGDYKALFNIVTHY